MKKVPSAVWIVDTKKEHIAVGEARKLGIPVVAILDTNCDPDEVDYKVPGNDDAIRSTALLTRVIADAVAEGLMARSAAQANAGRTEDGAEAPAVGGGEPLADWERELLTGGADAAAPAADAAVPAVDAAAPAADAAVPAVDAAAPAAEAPEATATELPETPAEPPTVTAEEIAPVEGVPATGDQATGTQGAQTG
jgi:small subunit ribosomal protein S2